MKNKTVRAMTLDALFLALLIVSSFISIDVGYCKFTLQLLTVFLIANFLSLVDGLIVIGLYIVMGLIGIPVFAGFGGGIAYAASPTFGFVYGFIFVILLNHLFSDVLFKKMRNELWKSLIASSVSLIALYAVGFVHGYLILTLVKGKSDFTLGAAFGLFLAPYIPFDIGKLVIASFISSRYVSVLLPSRRIHFNEIDSTNTYLKENYRIYKNLSFVDASYQSKGKGRLGRKWEASKDEALMFSVLIKDKKLLQNAPILSLVAGSAVFKFLEQIGLENVSIKWPNDIYVNGKKICGILLESVSHEKIDAVIIGIGLNVNQETFPEGFYRTPTSIRLETGSTMDLRDIKKDLYRIIKEEIVSFKEGTSDYLKVINEHNYLKDEKCFCTYKGEKKEIKVLRIDDEGDLVGVIDGDEKKIISDEITFE
ncbi:MAG: biotin--[Bacilli bacterium]|nr:biotin--[acetyl-CoA-carboxylase] ligase [Bacilli bacterium]